MNPREIARINAELKKIRENANQSFAGVQVVLMDVNRVLKKKISLTISRDNNPKDPDVGKAITAQYRLAKVLQSQLTTTLTKNQLQKINLYLNQLAKYTEELKSLMDQSTLLTTQEQRHVANLHKANVASKIDISALLNCPLGKDNQGLKAEIERSNLAELQAAHAILKNMRVPNRGSWEKKSSIETRREEIEEAIKNRLAKEADKKVPLKATPVRPILVNTTKPAVPARPTLVKPATKPAIPPRPPTYLQQAGHFKKPAGPQQPRTNAAGRPLPQKPLPPPPPRRPRNK